MSVPALVPPPGLKGVGAYLKIAQEHETRDPVVAYWARFWTVQRSLAIDKTSDDSKMFIVNLLGWLEKRKSELRDNEAVTNEAVAEAHIENYAIKLFKWADGCDRRGEYNKNVVKAYYTSSLLIDILENFSSDGNLGEEFERMRKYGRWRAALIHTAMKQGVRPEPPPSASNAGEEGGGGSEFDEWNSNFKEGEESEGAGASNHDAASYAAAGSTNAASAAAANWQEQDLNAAASSASAATGPALSVDVISRAQKYCKWAGSALNFDDVPTAIDNLEKALSLLKRGVE